MLYNHFTEKFGSLSIVEVNPRKEIYRTVGCIMQSARRGC